MIRPAGPADVEAIAELETGIFGADSWSPSQVAADLEAPARYVLVTEIDGRVVGYAAIAVAGDSADLLRIAVADAFRRTGIASALLDDVELLVADAGADRVVLEVAASNIGAREFYRERGYVEIARRSGYYAGGGDALVFARALG
jgi:ribosomal-protein-alanine N-acetyltransferase